VAVKIQRPRIDDIVEIDLRAIHWAVRLIKKYPAIRRRADLEKMYDEFARVLREELDYVKEARNALLFRSNFAGDPGIVIPEPYTEHSTSRVLVMERVTGLKLNDYAGLEAAGVSRAELATRINRSFLQQFFLDGFFHADPHPGNMFVRVEGPPAPASNGTHPGAPFTLVLLDTGMVGHLAPNMMDAMRSAIIGVATNDAERVVEALDKLHMLLPGADRRQVVQAISIVMRYTYDRSQRELTNMDVDRIFDETEHLVRDMPFQIPQDLIYLGRAVSMVSGIVTGLNPDINLFEETRPFANQMIERERRAVDWRELMQRELTGLGQIAATLPRQMDTYFKSANRGELQLRVDLTRLERSMRRVERATTRLAGGVMAGALFVGGVFLRINAIVPEAYWAWGIAAVVMVWALWPRG
jgi:predicted unusual protein kinase regulating ubiquinone biosynthesis (AarF/ABC1/UbiB family)